MCTSQPLATTVARHAHADRCPRCGPVVLSIVAGRLVADRVDGQGRCACTFVEREQAEADRLAQHAVLTLRAAGAQMRAALRARLAAGDLPREAPRQAA